MRILRSLPPRPLSKLPPQPLKSQPLPQRQPLPLPKPRHSHWCLRSLRETLLLLPTPLRLPLQPSL